MVLIVASAVAGVERMSVLLGQVEDKALLTIKILNEHKALSRLLVDKLSKKNDVNLNTKDINIYLISLLLEHYKAEMHCTCKDNSLEIGLTIA